MAVERRRSRRWVWLVVLGLLAIAGWRFLRTLSSQAPLRIGYAVEAPYAYLDADGRVTGESPEIARRISERLGRGEPEWVLAEFGSLITQLREGRFDVIAAGMFITDERARLVAFSLPTLSVGPALLVASGNPRELYSYADVAKWGHVRVAAMAGSVEVEALISQKVPRERIVLVPDPLSGVELLKSGRVDGLALSSPTVQWLANQPGHFGMLEAASPFTPPVGVAISNVAFAFRHDDVALRKAWDGELSGFLGGGEHQRLLADLGIAQYMQTRGGK